MLLGSYKVHINRPSVRVLSVHSARSGGEESVPASGDGAGAGGGDLVHRDLDHAHCHTSSGRMRVSRAQLVQNTHIQTPERLPTTSFTVIQVLCAGFSSRKPDLI